MDNSTINLPPVCYVPTHKVVTLRCLVKGPCRLNILLGDDIYTKIYSDIHFVQQRYEVNPENDTAIELSGDGTPSFLYDT